jgi:hypothetical protein
VIPSLVEQLREISSPSKEQPPAMLFRVTKGCGLDCEKELPILDISLWGELIFSEPINVCPPAVSEEMSFFEKETFFFLISQKNALKKAQRGATLSTLGVYKGLGGGGEKKEKIRKANLPRG